MVSYRKNSRVNTGGFPEKVISIAKYDIDLITSLHMKPSNKMTIERGAANIVATYFEYYLDTKARSNPEKFHHVYEFDKTGDADRRLFKKNLSSTAEGAIISFSFKPAKRPNREGYLFSNKASIMESGETVIVKPKSSKYLMYRVDETGIFVKTSKPSVIRYPGGQYVKGAFKNEFQNELAVATPDEFLFYLNKMDEGDLFLFHPILVDKNFKWAISFVFDSKHIYAFGENPFKVSLL